MKQILAIIIFLFQALITEAQNKVYKEYDVCFDSVTYKGKKNHGKYHCVGWATVREYKNGIKDTIAFKFGNNQIFSVDEYEKYKKLSERGRYIIDSLEEDGIAQLNQSYLTYEPMYMKDGQKIEQLWSIYGETVVVYKYKFWKSKKSSGVLLLNRIECK